MAKKTYVGVNNVARNVGKMYVGVNGVARRVKKAYVGVNGVARQFYRKIATSVTKISSGLDFSYGMDEAGTAQNENYVLFNGNKRPQGATSTEHVLTVNAFDKNLTRTIPSDLHVDSGLGYKESCSGARVGNYAIMGKSNTINRYDTSLIRGTVSINIGDSWANAPTASINGYAILGRFSVSNSNSWSFFAINESLTVQYVSSLSTPIVIDAECASAFENKMYIFGGGDTNYRSIDDTLTLTNEGSYSTFTSAKCRMMTGTTSKYCFCVGGQTETNDYTTPTYQGFAVDDVGTKASASLGSGNQVSSGGGVASSDLFLVGGGALRSPSSSNDFSKKIYQFDNSLTKTVISDLDCKVLWNYGNAYWNGYFIFHNARTGVGTTFYNVDKANLYQEQ